MKSIIFFDSEEHRTLLPLTFTRPVSHIRVGILKIHEKWEKRLNLSSSNYTQPHLEREFPMSLSEDNLFILGGLLPNEELINAVKELGLNQSLVCDGWILAARGENLHAIKSPESKIQFNGEIRNLIRPWDIFTFNGAEIEKDLELIIDDSYSDQILECRIIGDKNNVFIHPSAKVYATSINASEGPVFIGKNAEIMEGSVIRGPFSLGKHSVVKMGAKIYGGTTIGPHSKVGGEISNCVIQGYSNKGHDGFIGNSVIGEWCNLGADTNSSNLKNNYSEVRVWDYLSENSINTGLSFCGLIMGDHSKTGINTMLNTGTIVGVGSNIFGASFPPKFIPSFSWGSGNDFQEHDFDKFCSTAQKVQARRKVEFTENQKFILRSISDQTGKYRM